MSDTVSIVALRLSPLGRLYLLDLLDGGLAGLTGRRICLQTRPTLNFHFKTMALTIEEVRKIASLARLRFTPEEEVTMAGQLGQIVDYIDQLQRLDAGKPGASAASPAPGAPPAQASPSAPEADDLPRPCLPRESFLANAPATLDGFLRVPEVHRTIGAHFPEAGPGGSDDAPS